MWLRTTVLSSWVRSSRTSCRKITLSTRLLRWATLPQTVWLRGMCSSSNIKWRRWTLIQDLWMTRSPECCWRIGLPLTLPQMRRQATCSCAWALRTRYSCLRPSMQSRKSTAFFDKNVHCSPRFAAGDPVFALNLRSGPRWVPGVIIDVLNRSYYVQVEQKVWKRHEDQLRKRSPLFEPPSDPEPVPGSLAPDSSPAVMPSFPAPAPLPEPTTPPAPPPELAPPRVALVLLLLLWCHCHQRLCRGDTLIVTDNPQNIWKITLTNKWLHVFFLIICVV